MPFGGKRGEGTGITASNYLFTDQELDKESGLYNYDARLYDPVVGRFASADPMVQAPFSSSSFNRYSYSWNKPIKYVDPSGYYADMSDAVDDSYGDYGGYDGGFGEGRCITKGETKDEVDPAGNVHYDIQYYNIGPCNQCRKKASNSHTGVSDGGGEGSSGYGAYSGPPDLGIVAPEFFLDPEFFIGGIGGIVKGSIAGFGFRSFRGLASRRGTSLLSQFDNSLINDVISSAGTQLKQTTKGVKHLAKKLGHAQSQGYRSAFSGIKPTQVNADKLIRDVLSNPSSSTYGKKTVDVYNSLGQGVRFNRTTNQFVGFIEKSLSTR
jgi:RHS repeat-associated protein